MKPEILTWFLVEIDNVENVVDVDIREVGNFREKVYHKVYDEEIYLHVGIRINENDIEVKDNLVVEQNDMGRKIEGKIDYLS